MDYPFLLILILAFATVKCQNATIAANTTDTKNATVEAQTTEPKETTLAVTLPNLCTVCICTDDSINCDNRNLTNHFDDSQWPEKRIKVATFKENLLVHVKPFPKLEIRKLILQKNKITKIDATAFKQLINLTELDLSHNQLTGENLQPHVFEGKFSPEAYEPLEKLVVLNLAHNVLHTLHQDIFEHMTSLKVLNLSGNLFSKIDSRTSIALSSLPDLEELDLSYCGLKTLPDIQFYSSRVLKKLNLSGNQFATAPTALKEATTLEILYMDENPIQVINHAHSFPTMPKLKELSLCCMPYLTMVGSGAFAGLTSLESLRIENCPKLESIDDYALTTVANSEGPEWPPLKKLDLSNNALRYLPQQFVARWDWLEELNLMNNKWSCDCNNQYLIGMLLPKYGKKLMGEEVNGLTCATPPEHAGKNLMSLSHRKLRCLDMNGARPEKDATILIGVLIGLLLAIPVCLTIFVLWRRGYFFCGTQGPASFSRAFYKRAMDDDEI
ncbi:Leucine-rich repeat neuronal protein 2 [Eufriesea mexicana]|uniref:leucine-rich repeat neuronal protein 1-like n=1 Tax=Eufriesea mexicana TaxID=516756 RepID=UPI00083BB252|nr:PREDICTED: leucine-rich repeat neuronal protein 1-like [Eufriesea mexicana]OAD57813.1 Leucine-rich repeat neuronal protein 2 [Eufriesea mexicana]